MERSKRRLIPIIWSAVGICILAIGARYRTAHEVAPGRVPAVGTVAPDFALPDSEGHILRLSTLRGRMVLLSFLCACSRCRDLAPEWQRVHQAFPEVAVPGIAALGPAHIQEFRRATRATFPMLFDAGYTVANRYGSLECPRSWLLDASGEVVWTAHPEEGRAAVAAALRRYLGTPPGTVAPAAAPA
jgi:peroxiredoxin